MDLLQLRNFAVSSVFQLYQLESYLGVVFIASGELYYTSDEFIMEKKELSYNRSQNI